MSIIQSYFHVLTILIEILILKKAHSIRCFKIEGPKTIFKKVVALIFQKCKTVNAIIMALLAIDFF